MMIGEKTKAEAQAMLQSLFKDHWTEIKEAYTKSDETGLTVFFSVALKERDGLVHLKTNISFISDRVKDELTLDINEKQQEFPGMKKEAIHTGKGKGKKNEPEKKEEEGGEKK